MDNVPATTAELSTPFITAAALSSGGGNGCCCSSCCSRKVAACVSFLKFSKKEPSLLNVFLRHGQRVESKVQQYSSTNKKQTHLKGVPLGLTLALACSSTGCWLANVVVVVVCCCCCLSNISRFFRKIISSCSHICTTRWFRRLVGLGRDILSF